MKKKQKYIIPQQCFNQLLADSTKGYTIGIYSKRTEKEVMYRFEPELLNDAPTGIVYVLLIDGGERSHIATIDFNTKILSPTALSSQYSTEYKAIGVVLAKSPKNALNGVIRSRTLVFGSELVGRYGIDRETVWHLPWEGRRQYNKGGIFHLTSSQRRRRRY